MKKEELIKRLDYLAFKPCLTKDEHDELVKIVDELSVDAPVTHWSIRIKNEEVLENYSLKFSVNIPIIFNAN